VESITKSISDIAESKAKTALPEALGAALTAALALGVTLALAIATPDVAVPLCAMLLLGGVTRKVFR
jgi:hypothetical protein